MELSKLHRILLINQYKMLAALDKNEESRYLELAEILESGYSIFYPMIDEWLSEDMPEVEGKLVLEVLDLYREIESIKRLTKDPRISEHHYATFPGFDGNNETQHWSFCRFLVETQGKFQEQKQYLQKNDGMNSHTPMLEKYRRMLKKRKALGAPRARDLSVDQILQVLEA